MKSCFAGWNPTKFGWNLQPMASDEIKSASYLHAQAWFHRVAISSTIGGFIPTQADLVEKRASLFDLLFFLWNGLQAVFRFVAKYCKKHFVAFLLGANCRLVRQSPVLLIPKEKGHPIGRPFSFGADYGARTRHLHLGKVALYQMS